MTANSTMRMLRAVFAVSALSGAIACNDLSGVNKSSLPSGTQDPNRIKTPAGAMAMYQNAVYTFEYAQRALEAGNGTTGATTGVNGAFVDFMLYSGIFTDELQAGNLGGPASAYFTNGGTLADSLDARQLVEGEAQVAIYNRLHGVRGAASQGIGALKAYAPNAPVALQGKLYAIRGYAELMLADLFCSGVPLSTLDFNGDYTYQPGSTTSQVYEHAVAQFDTALSLATDSTRIMNLARVGRGRALLALGRYSDAGRAVANVPDDFAYQFLVDWKGGLTVGSIFSSFTTSGAAIGATVADREGVNGLPYISSNDPRSQAQSAGPNQYGRVQYAPVKYGGTGLGVLPITVASGMEARLIEAEASFQAHDVDGLIGKLNRARTLASNTLPTLTDPGNDSARVALLFSERGFDLFLTGHRQGDMRRMVREYRLPQNTVYPTGGYPSALSVYGSSVNLPIPSNERRNPKFTGCIDRSA